MNEIILIIKALEDLGVSQQDMATASGLTQGRISQLKGGGTCAYEAGRRLHELLAKTQRKADKVKKSKPKPSPPSLQAA